MLGLQIHGFVSRPISISMRIFVVITVHRSLPILGTAVFHPDEIVVSAVLLTNVMFIRVFVVEEGPKKDQKISIDLICEQ